MKFVKSKEWLLEHLDEKNVRIVDCQFSLAAPQKGIQDYLEKHIPGAVHFDLEKDLSGIKQEHGGRHPLPVIEELAMKLEKAGIGSDTTVIAYDGGEGAFAARFWWLMKYLGHERAFVLDGGFKGWLAAEYPVTADIPAFGKTEFQVTINPQMIADVKNVLDVTQQMRGSVTLIDSREEKRYLGLEEPIDKKAGHIPGAINKPWMEGLSGCQYKPEHEQKERFADLDTDKQIIVYCGSGVTAAPNFIALKEAGFEDVKLYVGSFSDWISYKENKID